ncbi:MAG: thioredoxin [Candidatus Poribacteria bacterium]|nr:thioredoxin [Candidatus Poribacteria bacterium]
MTSHRNCCTLTALNFHSDVLKSDVPVVVDFWADWCVPCRAFDPIVDELSDEYAGRFRFGKLNVDENRAIAGEYGVQTIPMLLVFKNGELVEQMVGMRPKSDIRQVLERIEGAA